MAVKTFVYKLRPTRSQEAALAEALDTCRRLYNRALGERTAAYEHEQRSVGFAEQCASLPQAKKESAFLPRVHSQVLQDVLHRLDHAFAAFFRRVKAGEKPGYPRFRGAGWYDSFTYRQYGNGAKFEGNRLVLSKIGAVKFCTDRPLQGNPKTCTIVRKARGWFAHITCEVEPEPLPKTGETVGMDLGIESFATLSNGETVENPRHYRTAERKLKTAQRRLSRRQKGTRGRCKARRLLARAHLKVRRTRRDFCHKVAHDLVPRFDHIVVEDLNIRGMVRNHPLAKSISDAGWGTFVTILSEKAESAAKTVEKVHPAYTSQVCSGCGERIPKALSQRWHSCPYCGLEIHRDLNAALNIQRKGGGTALVDLVAVATG